MATLNFKGKTTIWNHHLSVPYQSLDKVEELSYNPDKANGNLIVEGDNLIALKSLLPTYQGKVKCIYIDPPYNTGNEGWIYNDKVNSPMIREWLGKEVGGDDLTRHDKWLCMMTPRLKLLRELLADDGVIFISIDDNEQHHLCSLMQEIFGEQNFVANFIWEHRKSSQNDIDVSLSHNYTLTYAKDREKFKLNPLGINEDKFTNPDNDPKGAWVADPFDAPNIRPNLSYAIVNPETGQSFLPPTGRCWRFTEDKYREALLQGRIVFGKNGKSKPQYKRYKFEAEEKGQNISTIWDEVGTATSATKELMKLFDDIKIFNTPKPVELVRQIIKISCEQSSIILDSFAGSGTTAQAVLELNEEDGGNRQFILVQMKEDSESEPAKNICKDITRERVKRVIEQKLDNKYGFEYQRLGKLIDPEAMLEGDLPTYKEFAKYVYYLATGKSHDNEDQISEENYFVGSDDNLHIYLIYKQDYEALQSLALTLDKANEIKAKHNGHRKIVYAPACYMDEEYLKEFNIQFVSIPYNLFERIQK